MGLHKEQRGTGETKEVRKKYVSWVNSTLLNLGFLHINYHYFVMPKSLWLYLIFVKHSLFSPSLIFIAELFDQMILLIIWINHLD